MLYPHLDKLCDSRYWLGGFQISRGNGRELKLDVETMQTIIIRDKESNAQTNEALV
jgi:hypothetical protein